MLSVEDVEKTIPDLDYGMAKIIADAHNHGLITRFCCSGHSAPPGGYSRIKDGRDPTGKRTIITNRRPKPCYGYIVLHYNSILMNAVAEALLASPRFANFNITICKDKCKVPILRIGGIIKARFTRSSHPPPVPHPTIFILFLKLVMLKYLRLINQFEIQVSPQKLRVNDGILTLGSIGDDYAYRK